MPADSADPAVSDPSESKARRVATREALKERLRSEGANDLVARLDRCGKIVPLTCVCCGEHREAETLCKARWCPSCAPIVGIERKERWEAAVRQIQWPLFVTLTTPNSTDPEALRHLRKSWGKFRRRVFFKRTVRGGVGTFEITNKGNGWHPHVHAILDCRWFSLNVREPHRRDSNEIREEKCILAQRELSQVWADVIGEPESVVWVKRVAGADVVDYVLKYAAKGSELVACPDPVAPMIRVLAKTRTLSGFGSLFPLPSPDEDTGSVVVCPSCQSEKSYMPDEVLAILCRTDTYPDPRPAIPAASRKSTAPPEKRT